MSRQRDTDTNLAVARDHIPETLRGGAHRDLLAPDTVTFVLRVPFKPYVSLVGDFNGWNSRAHPMVSFASGTWWTTIPDPGATRYGFYVAIDDQSHVWVGDPYAREVEWDDSGAWAVLPARGPDFSWSDQGWRTPGMRDLVIYELGVRDFSGRWAHGRPIYGTFRDLTHYVDYFADMQINAVELMPIQEFPGESSWGYNPVFYFAPERTYGRPDDLKHFVNRCHARGIAVILDVAFNHAWGAHPYYLSYPPLYSAQGESLPDLNPFFHHTPPAVNMWGGVDWDHFTSDTTRYFQDVVRYWLSEYHIDGFRFDWVAGVDYDSRNPMQPDFDPYHGINAICWAARQTKPDCLLIGEYWPLTGTHPDKSAAMLVADTPMNSCWNDRFHHTVDEVLNQRWEWEKHNLPGAMGGFRDRGFSAADQVVNYTCSHDEVRPEHEIKFYSSRHISRPEGMSVDELALTKALLGLATLFAAPGVPMLYAGQEFGEDTPRTIDFLPLSWQKLQQPSRFRYQQAVKKLIQLRRSHPALRSDWIEFYADDFATDKLLRFKRWDGQGDAVVVALNFDQAQKATGLGLPWNGRWQELLSDRVYEVGHYWLDLELRPWQAVLFVPLTPAPD